MRSPLAELGSALRRVVAKAPVSYANRSLSFAPPWRNDMEQQMRAMGSVGTLFAIVNRLSNATSQVEWKLWRKAKSGKKEDRTPVTSHLALDVWNKPNPFHTRQEFIETFDQHQELTGEAWWLVGRDSRATLPMTLWPVRPDRMTVIPHPTEFITGYVYRGPDGEQVPLELTDVIQLRSPNPLDPYRGMGAVQSILVDLDAVKYTAEWNRNFFLNSAEPGGIIEVDKRLSDPEFDEMTSRWREQHQGVAQAHRVAVLEQGKWVDRKFSQRDMQFSELRSVSREVIRESFGFPLSMLGTSQDVNRAAAEAGEYVFGKWLIVPRLERIKGALNNDFLPLFGAGTEKVYEFDYESPVPEDEEAENAELTARAQATKTYIDAGFTPADGTTVTIDDVDLVFKKPDPAPAPAVPVLPEGMPAPPVPPPAGAALTDQQTIANAVRLLVDGRSLGGPFARTYKRDKDGKFGTGGGGYSGTASDLVHADAATKDAVMREVYEGKFGNLTTKVTQTGGSDGQVWVAGKIYNRMGREVGEFSRAIKMEDGIIYAEHGVLDLQRNVQGAGFASAFNANAIGFYRKTGVDAVYLHAVEVGGYAWATQGFGFADRASATTCVDELRDRVSALRAGRDRDQYGDPISKKLRGAKDLDRQLRAAESLLERAGRVMPDHPDYPTAYELSQAGRPAGAGGKSDTWIGKETMLGQSWQGVMHLKGAGDVSS